MAYNDNIQSPASGLSDSLKQQETGSLNSAVSNQTLATVSRQNNSIRSLEGYMGNPVGSIFDPRTTVGIGDRAAISVLNPMSLNDLNSFTSLDGSNTLSISNRDYYKGDCANPEEHWTNPVFALEKHITVIRKGPTMPLQLEMYPYEDATIDLDRADVSDLNIGGDYVGDDAIINSSFKGSRMPQSSNWALYLTTGSGDWMSTVNPRDFKIGLFWGDTDGTDYNTHGRGHDNADISIFYKPSKEQYVAGDLINLPLDIADTGEDWMKGDVILIEHSYLDSFGDNQKASARLEITEIGVDLLTPNNEVLTQDAIPGFIGVGDDGTIADLTNAANLEVGYGYFPCTLNDPDNPISWASPLGDGSIVGQSSACGRDKFLEAKIVSLTGTFPMDAVRDTDIYNVYLVQKPAIFELKFPKFSYRYKYEDGEYSVFAPWSEIAFVPGPFDYLPKKGYNLGMVNRLRKLKVVNWVPKNIPHDVVQVDILYKESNSPNIYTLSSHKEDDTPETGSTRNFWNQDGNGGHKGSYIIKSELIHKVVESNQLLRPWDNVPRKALAQEITANRLVFANYVQNFDLKDSNLQEIKPEFITSINSNDFSETGEYPMPGYAAKSLKSMRKYQVGVVYRDKYGRETPVLTSNSGSLKIPKSSAKLQNRLSVKLLNQAPYWAESFTFYIKETSNEYYNIAMDRWYDAEDGGIWLSFPSVERNKMSERTNLILKKQHDTNVFTDFDTRYKVLSIKNDAPTFIKTENKFLGSLPMMLPPPGWGHLGGWDSGMFYNTGLPLPNRMYLDIFAEYWDQSPFNELGKVPGAQIRIVQSAGAASAYVAATSDTTNKTRWYDVASISYIGSPPQTETVETTVDNITTINQVELPGQQEQLVRVSLEKAFGNDALFCEPTGNLSLSRGLSLEARTKVVRDKSQFEGRFFVKVLRDSNIEQNIIQPNTRSEDKYQVLATKKLKYICAAHPGLQDWSYKAIAADSTETPRTGFEIEDTYDGPSSHFISTLPDGTSVASGGTFADIANFIPIAINHQTGDASTRGLQHSPGYIWGTEAGINRCIYDIPYGNALSAIRTRLVSSFSDTHAGKGVHFLSQLGKEEEKQTFDKLWPYGPGQSAVGAFDTNGWGTFPAHSPNLKGDQHGANKSIWPNYRTPDDNFTSGNIPTDGTSTPVVSSSQIQLLTFTGSPFNIKGKIRDWPSFGPQIWNPYLSYSTDSDGNDIKETGILNRTWIDPTLTITGPYTDRILTGNKWVNDACLLSLKNCPALDSGNHTPIIPGFTSTAGGVSITSTADYSKHNYLQGANALSIPAVWGDQSDFLSATPEWNEGTFLKLRKDWYYLYYGKDKVHESWPLGRFDPDRWIIDKAGAAQGYSGNGIWDDGKVGYMDVAYYGVGRRDSFGLKGRTMSFRENFEEFNDNEVGFAQLISTIGTQFRFRYDPDGIIYTITGVQEREIYNFEAPQGTWGVENEDGTISGGSGIGYKSPAPQWGASGPLAGGPAFISDLYSPEPEMMGSTPINKRIRWTLTLDKIIGDWGDHKFHPLRNHVDENGKANIELGRAKYQRRFDHITDQDGATPGYVEYYNLASYYNTTRGVNRNDSLIGADPLNPELFSIYGFGDGSTGTVPDAKLLQPDTVNMDDTSNFYYRNPLCYIGLHERGLNQTEIQIVTPYKGEDRDKPMSSNPAIWETEPMEDVGLDIYYAASPSYPITLNRYRSDYDVHVDTSSLMGEIDANGANWYDYSDRGEEVVKVGSIVKASIAGVATDIYTTVCSVQDDIIWLSSGSVNPDTGRKGSAFSYTTGESSFFSSATLNAGDTIKIVWRGEGTFYGVGRDEEWMEFVIDEALSGLSYRIRPLVHNNIFQLGYYNCWSFGTGVESNRVRDDFNAVTIDKGVKASMPLATTYEEERRSSGLIFSGIYNSTSGVNSLNQFIQAEPITKDLNPINGSIQKLFARDTDLVTFCENKVFKILAKKDALFNADGNTNVTSNQAVLGQSIPFSGEYGISKNPESFASESYRMYFTDKDRGAVLRLSRDGLTPISDQGMKDWFKDNMQHAKSLIGSYDNRDDQYNLTIETLNKKTREEKEYTLSYTEKKRGWESFKSFITQGGISHKNTYYTFPWNKTRLSGVEYPWGVPKNSVNASNSVLNNNSLRSTESLGSSAHVLNTTSAQGEMFQHYVDTEINTQVLETAVATTTELAYVDIPYSKNGEYCIPGMNIEGEGIPIDTIVTRISHSTSGSATPFTRLYLNNDIDISQLVYTNGTDNTNGLEYLSIQLTASRNTFYHNFGHYSMVNPLFNGDKGTVKRFKTLDYEGSQARVGPETLDPATGLPMQHQIGGTNVGEVIYDNYPKLGWYADTIKTDIQDGKVPEFKNKENKWFNNIVGYDFDPEKVNRQETSEFAIQGLGKGSENIVVIKGCMATAAPNYNPFANTPEASCLGCTDPISDNYYNWAHVNVPEGGSPVEFACTYTYGCMDPGAFNFGCKNKWVFGDVDPATGCSQTDGVNKHNVAACTYLACTDPSALNYPGSTLPGATVPLEDHEGNTTSIGQYENSTLVSCIYP
tara:strand:+ start:205 stop:7854 length:7650 start_codon:yes stop_codon:yes gene_type:complete